MLSGELIERDAERLPNSPFLKNSRVDVHVASLVAKAFTRLLVRLDQHSGVGGKSMVYITVYYALPPFEFIYNKWSEAGCPLNWSMVADNVFQMPVVRPFTEDDPPPFQILDLMILPDLIQALDAPGKDRLVAKLRLLQPSATTYRGAPNMENPFMPKGDKEDDA